MVNGLVARSRHLIASAALCAAALLPFITPKPAEAWWGPGWGWRGGVAVAFPPVVVGAPVYPSPAYYSPYAPAYAYAQPYWRWVPEHRVAHGIIVAGHWEH
jgi:hypothetical protein